MAFKIIKRGLVGCKNPTYGPLFHPVYNWILGPLVRSSIGKFCDIIPLNLNVLGIGIFTDTWILIKVSQNSQSLTEWSGHFAGDSLTITTNWGDQAAVNGRDEICLNHDYTSDMEPENDVFQVGNLLWTRELCEKQSGGGG